MNTDTQTLREMRERLKREESKLRDHLNGVQLELRQIELELEKVERSESVLGRATELWGDQAEMRLNVIKQVQQRATKVKKFMNNGRTRHSVFMLNSAVQGSFPTRRIDNGDQGKPGDIAWWRILNAMANIMRNDNAAKSGELTDRVNWLLKEEQEKVWGE